MTYTELMKATIGKTFIRSWDNKIFTRTQFYFEADKEQISMALNGYEGTWMIRDKEGWQDGVIVDEDMVFIRT